MSEPAIELETVNLLLADGVATVELNRPQALNAWNKQFGAGPARGARQVAADEAARAVVITGAGRAFSSGADLKDVRRRRLHARGAPRRIQGPDRALPPDHARDPRDAKAGDRIRERPGGRHRLLAGAVLRLIVAAQSAYFLLAFVNIGLVPDGGSSLFVPTRVGMARATELAMLGERLPAPSRRLSGV